MLFSSPLTPEPINSWVLSLCTLLYIIIQPKRSCLFHSTMQKTQWLQISILSSRIASSNQKDYIFSVVNKIPPILPKLSKPWMHAASAAWMYTEFAPTITNHRRQSYPNKYCKELLFCLCTLTVCKPWVRRPYMSCSNTACDCTNTLNIEMSGTISN